MSASFLKLQDGLYTDEVRRISKKQPNNSRDKNEAYTKEEKKIWDNYLFQMAQKYKMSQYENFAKRN